MIKTFRDRVARFVPPWLQFGNNAKLLYAVLVQLDIMGDALVAGVKSRFPGHYSFDSLSQLGRERRIVRGPNEPDATYAGRLIRWLDDHRTRGGPYAMLAQIYAFYAPNNFAVDLVYRNGRRYRMDADGNIVRDQIDWHPDTMPEKWARWWLFYWTDAFPAPTPEQIATLKLVPTEWNAAHTLGTLYVMPSNAELLNYPPGHTVNESGTINRPGPSAVLDIG